MVSSYRQDQFDEIREPLKQMIDNDRCIEVCEDYILGDNGYSYYEDVLKLTKVYETEYKLVRIGNAIDGGYVMADKCELENPSF